MSTDLSTPLFVTSAPTASAPATATAAASYYAIGSIPGRVFSNGEPVHFTVAPPQGVTGPVSVRLTAAGYGTPSVSTDADGNLVYSYLLPATGSMLAYSFNPTTGDFAYTPDQDDRFDFELEFATPGIDAFAMPYAQRVTVLPRTTPNEYDLVSSSTQNLPGPESADYVTVTVSDGSLRHFNSEVDPAGNLRPVQTRRVEITGKTVSFTAGNANALYERFAYDPSVSAFSHDIEAVTVYAERIFIGSQTRFPQTDVTLYARELVFVDNGGVASQLNTTPFDNRESRARQFASGSSGENAGNITLNVERLTAPSGSGPRFVLNGGNGQAAGEGATGRDGASLPVVATRDGNRAVAVFTASEWGHGFLGCGKAYFSDPNYPLAYGTPSWPEDATPATPGGNPGDGGRGGTLRLAAGLDAASVQGVTSAEAGSAGARAADLPGYTGGSPRNAHWFFRVAVGSCTGKRYDLGYWRARNSSDAAPWIAPFATHGNGGGVEPLAPADSPAWLHPALLRPMVNYIKDAYLAGNIDFAREATAAVTALLGQTSPADPLAEQYGQLRVEVEVMRARAIAGLDYYGNPAGWTPMLSFVANVAAYKAEIESAIRIKYLTGLVESAAARGESAAAGMQKALSQLDVEISHAAAAMDQQQALLPRLQEQMGILTTGIANFQSKLVVKEQEFQRQAESNLRPAAWRQALSVLGTIAQVIPVYQPALGLVGTGLKTIADLSDKPLEAIGQIKGVVDSFKDSGEVMKKTRDDFSALTKSLKPPSNASNAELKDYAKRVADYGKQWAGAIKGISDSLQQYTAPKDKIEAELARLKAQDPAFASLVDELTALNAQKEVFARDLANAMKIIGDSMTEVSAYQQQAVALNRQVSDGRGRLDREAIQQVRDMGRRADERLLRYQYYMAKAYEYETLKPYTGSFRLGALSDRIGRVLGAGGNAGSLEMASVDDPSKTNFELLRGVYEDGLRSIADQIFTEKNTTVSRRSSTSAEFKLTPIQLEELDSKGRVTINLVDMGVIGESEDAAKVLQMTATELTTAPVTGVSTARLRLTFEHSGSSLIESDGRTYLFRHLRGDPSEATRPLLVGTTNYDAVLKRPPTPTTPDPAEVALLSYLLFGRDIPANVLYAQPGAWSNITIRKESVSGVPIHITDGLFKVTYTYENAPADRAVLDVRPAPGLTPLVSVATPGVNEASGRADGVGAFSRSYRDDQPVTLIAQPTFGSLRFDHWADVQGKTISTRPRLDMILSGDRLVQPVYTPGAVIRGSVFFDADGDGVRDAGEPGLGGRTLYVDRDNDATPDPDEPWVVTDSSGVYAFTNLAAGAYKVRVAVPAGSRLTTPSAGYLLVALQSGQKSAAKNFGIAGGPAVVGRYAFYNGSNFDGNNGAANAADDGAVARDKQALLPGQAPTSANVINYSRGINGVMIDVAGLPAGVTPSAADFALDALVGSAWAAAPGVSAVSVRRGAGAGGSDRVTIIWSESAVQNGWLRVTLLATPRTGLPVPDVFAFGSLIGDTGDNAASFRVNALDLAGVKRDLNHASDITGRFDFNRDGRVNALDLGIVKQNLNRTLATLTAPSVPTSASPFPSAPALNLSAPSATRRIGDEPPVGLLD